MPLKEACDCVVLLPSLPPFHALRVYWVRFRPCFCAIVDTGMMMTMMPSFQPLRMPFKSLLYLAMQTITPAVAAAAAPPPVYNSRSSSVRHACPAKGERTRDALVDIPIANVLAKPAMSWLIHCHWELDANTHDRIRPAPRRALLGSALPVNVDLAFPTSALEFRCTARLLVQALKILRRRFPDRSQ